MFVLNVDELSERVDYHQAGLQAVHGDDDLGFVCVLRALERVHAAGGHSALDVAARCVPHLLELFQQSLYRLQVHASHVLRRQGLEEGKEDGRYSVLVVAGGSLVLARWRRGRLRRRG